VLAPNGNLITANGDAVNPGRTPNELVEFTPQGRLAAEYEMDAGAINALLGHYPPTLVAHVQSFQALAASFVEQTQTSDNRLRRFASFFRGYMGVMPLVTAAFAPVLTMLRAIPGIRKPDAPSCLVLDLELPDTSGLELQRELAAGDGPPIVFITGHGDIPSSVRAMKAGAIEFLPKPFREEDLLQAVDAAQLSLIEKGGGRDLNWPSYRSITRFSRLASGRYCPPSYLQGSSIAVSPDHLRQSHNELPRCPRPSVS
jgi:CheY-like chemotaxis protein